MSLGSGATPYVFGKCAEAAEKKRVAGVLRCAVCDKCAEANGNKGIKGSRGPRDAVEGAPYPRVFCMNIKRKGMWEEGFAWI